MNPKEWLVSPLSDIVKEKISYGIVQAGPHVPNGVPYIKSSDVKGTIKPDSLQKTSHDIHYKYRRSSVHPGDIVFSLRGNIGESAIVPKDLPEANLTQGTARISVNENHHNIFHFYQISSSPVLNRINALSKGSTFKEISLEELRKVKVICPPLPEQKKIAKILSTWDKAITTTEQLLANSKQQKKALMQQLLTGKKRLPGFSGEWTDHHLTDIAKVIVSPVDKKTVDNEIPVELCNYTDVYYNTYINRKLKFMRATAKQTEIDKFTLQVGDVIITKDSETPGDIAVPALVAEELGGVVCGYHLAIIRPNNKKLDGAFLNFLLSMPQTRYYFFTLATGATRFGLSINGINKAHFSLPPLEEQQKIATILSTVDKEIETLQQKLDCLKQEKKALMQQLLTGKRRVNVDELEVA
ncbi:restriction endonuclease subunit S [Zooshikella ganghwensis]|uniref:restriction endonuclease subunit S n=1 Tax=Zooshikella ganghwensis TaxID=202772 RepID=UPI000413519A|nr:restriction endonuclease subunit S [Zooshikella ganghwensis]